MKFPCTISRTADGRWTLSHESADLGHVEVTASTRDQALEKLRQEIRYRLELCPCSGDTYQYVDVEIVESVKGQ